MNSAALPSQKKAPRGWASAAGSTLQPLGPSAVRTVKVGSGIRRIVLQEDTNRETFEVLWPLTEGRRVIKRRYRVPEGGLTWEVDEFTDRDLVLAEIELPSEEVKPRLPDWIAPYVVREVTDESEYLNMNLAR